MEPAPDKEINNYISPESIQLDICSIPSEIDQRNISNFDNSCELAA